MLKRTVSLSLMSALLVASVTTSAAASTTTTDAITTRQALMDASAAAAGLSAAMLKKEMPYNATAAKSAITTLWAASHAIGPLFEKKSDSGDTSASPDIWTDHAGFEKELQAYIADTNAAMKVSGKDGPADLAAFKQVMPAVLNHCKACHQDYKIKK